MRKSYSKALTLILILAVIIAAVLLYFQQNNHLHATAQDGVLKLSQRDFNAEGHLALSGEWEFYWGKFLDWNDFNSNSKPDPIHVKVPEVWDSFKQNGNKLPGFGYATYRLAVTVPESSAPLALRIGSIFTAYQCYVNDILIAENGKISVSSKGEEPSCKPVTAFFLPPAEEFDLIIHVSNFTRAQGGISEEIVFDTAEQIREYESFLKYKDGIIIGMLTLIAISVFCYSLLSRISRKNLMFILMCIILIVRTMFSGDYLIVQLFPDIPFQSLVWIFYLTVIWFPVILYHMIESYTGKLIPSFTRIFFPYAFVLSALTGLAPISVYTRWFGAIEWISAFIFISTLINASLAYFKRIPGANIIFIGSFIVALTGLCDLLNRADIICFPLEALTPIGLIILMFLLFISFAKKFSDTYREVHTLSSELAARLNLDQEMAERLYALDKVKDDFLTNASNELSIPLNGIINITKSLLNGIGGQTNQIHRQNLEVILASAKKLHTLLSDLLDVSLLKSGGIPIHMAPLDLHALVSNVLVVFQHIKNNKDLRLIHEIPADFPLVMGDENRLRQILNNLIENAIKFTAEGQVCIGACHDGKRARIYITDTGCGIAPEQLANIFKAFELNNGIFQRKYENSGVGLYLTMQLVELHGGRIWITSTLGRGTQVFFTLSLSKDQPESPPALQEIYQSEAKEPDFTETETEPEQNKAPFDILVVDDDFSSLQVLMNILQLENYRVKGVRTGREALSILNHGAAFKLVILDAMMPELSGFETLEILRKKYNRLELPVLMLTAKAQTKDMSLCFKLGANDYLAKPFEEDELVVRVNSLVTLKRSVNKLVSTEMSFLQAQIKPHFIHNTLSIISSLSIKNPPKAKSLILDLSDYLRGSFALNDEEGLTTLSKELGLVKAYLSIEQARFKDRLQVNYDLREELDCTIPLLTIQPLVENAIQHGILCRTKGGKIYITTSMEPNRVRIEVRDNGVGIEPDRIRKVYELNQDQKGVGLINVHRRLMTKYGDGLHIDSILGQGTTVYFYVPYVSGKVILETPENELSAGSESEQEISGKEISE